MKKSVLSLILIAVTLIACVAAFAADPASVAAPLIPDHDASPMPALPALPVTKDLGSILVWILFGVVPWLGWLFSEILPFLPGKANGIVHGFIDGLKAQKYDQASNTITLDVGEFQAAIAEIKGQIAAIPAGTPGPSASEEQ